MRSELKCLESDPPKNIPQIPHTILAYDDTPNMSSIESPLSSARKRFNARVMDEYVKKTDTGLSPEQIVASLEKSMLKRSKTIPEIGKKSDDKFSRHHEHIVKETRTLDYPPSFIEASMISEIGADRSIFQQRDHIMKRRSIVSKDDSLSTLTLEDKPPPDFSGEVMDFFDRQSRLKERLKKNKPSEKEFLRNNTEELLDHKMSVNDDNDEGFGSIFKRNTEKRKLSRKKSDSRQKKKIKGRTSKPLPSELGEDLLPERQEHTTREKKKRKKSRRECGQPHDGVSCDCLRSSKGKRSSRSSNGVKKRSLKYGPISSNTQDGISSCLSKEEISCLLSRGDSEKSIDATRTKRRTTASVNKLFPEAA